MLEHNPPYPQLSPGHCQEGDPRLLPWLWELHLLSMFAESGPWLAAAAAASWSSLFNHASFLLSPAPVREWGPWLWDEGFSSQLPLRPVFSTPLSPSCHSSHLQRTAVEEAEMLPPHSLFYLSLDPQGTQNPPLPSETNPRVTS